MEEFGGGHKADEISNSSQADPGSKPRNRTAELAAARAATAVRAATTAAGSDVIDKLNSLRGRGMAKMYSWSCKRSYKNAFVWNDLCEDDLIVPARENEYVLKGSELVEENNSDCVASARNIKSQTLEQQAGPPSATNIIGRQTKTSQENDVYDSRTIYRIYKCAHALADASTQTDEHVKVQKSCTTSFLTDNGVVGSLPSSYGVCSSAGRTNTLESLMKADDSNLNTYEKLEEQEEFQVPTNKKLRSCCMLLQLISCGSSSSRDHDFRQALFDNFRSTDAKLSSSLFTPFATLSELDCLSENSRFTGMRSEDKQYLSASSVETTFPNKEEINSNNRINKCASILTCTKCIPRSIMGSLTKHSRIASIRLAEGPNSCILSPCISNNGSKRITVACLAEKPSKIIEYFKDIKKNVIKVN